MFTLMTSAGGPKSRNALTRRMKSWLYGAQSPASDAALNFTFSNLETSRHSDPTTAHRLLKISRAIRSSISNNNLKNSEIRYHYKRSQWDCFTWAMRHHHTDVLAYQNTNRKPKPTRRHRRPRLANHSPIVDLPCLALQSGSIRLRWEEDKGAIHLQERHLHCVLKVTARHGDAAVISLFLRTGRGALTPDHITDAFDGAAKNGHSAVVKVLLDAEADANEGIEAAAATGHV
ncbi:hypothetical protein HK097_007794 [Rhizophlyctis rosea]|uniref:Uncharacterized protein n=1 Tax=Rhizophlyctis rosea TaxID=64517 RepID=A0AAD5X9F3_9FUNG|nr:hypothetical protein HK097_007794 [Rhizophlyctis rosea]